MGPWGVLRDWTQMAQGSSRRDLGSVRPLLARGGVRGAGNLAERVSESIS